MTPEAIQAIIDALNGFDTTMVPQIAAYNILNMKIAFGFCIFFFILCIICIIVGICGLRKHKKIQFDNSIWPEVMIAISGFVAAVCIIVGIATGLVLMDWVLYPEATAIMQLLN